jgi:hypothetical protein
LNEAACGGRVFIGEQMNFRMIVPIDPQGPVLAVSAQAL